MARAELAAGAPALAARTPALAASVPALADDASARDAATSIDAGDLAACRALLADGSRTFLAASRLLPRAVADPACVLYAFCRLADDAIDGVAGAGLEAPSPSSPSAAPARPTAGNATPASARPALAASCAAAADGAPAIALSPSLAALHARLEAIYRGTPPDDAPGRALAAVVRLFDLPRALLDALLDGFAWDAEGRRYESIEELEAYAARVAGSVGAMMSVLMGARSASALARACDLGVAMQLSNIARDVGEDARAGRVYLPLRWLRQAGIDPEEWLRAPRHDARLAGVVGRLLDRADALYARVGAGVAELPPACRPGIQAARLLYAEIGREVARRGCNAVDSRAVVSRARKLALVGVAALSCWSRRPVRAEPALAATLHLVDAAARPAGSAVRERDAGPSRVVWLIDLFDRLERQDLARAAAPR